MIRKKQFEQLSSAETLLRGNMVAFIITAIKENQGKISLKIAKDTELEDENYPITSTLYGRHDNPQIRLTSVYLDKYDKIYADGIDDDTGEKRKEFYIYPEQYSDIFYFIGHMLNLV